MKKVSIIGVDLAKNVFQLHGAAADGAVLFRKKLSRPQFQRFMSEHPQCLVAMEAGNVPPDVEMARDDVAVVMVRRPPRPGQRGRHRPMNDASPRRLSEPAAAGMP